MKVFLTVWACIATSFLVQAQVDRTNFRAGVNAGLVIGDFSEAYSLSLGLDIYQHWGVSRELDVGLTTGFSNAFGEKQSVSAGGVVVETEFDNVQFIPVGGSIRVYPTSGFKFGGDVGYAVGINKGNQGSLYYRPSIGVDLNGGSSELNISYFAVNDDVVFSTVLVGFLILF
ncbi:hypothetical protein [Maribacter sp. 2304DJ31-5]|uniref:hypothetical protein n=1 Tax=Maribacter sp. 2304DJ31-5 TaxID=3386273 RepID=UPI0039BD80BD